MEHQDILKSTQDFLTNLQGARPPVGPPAAPALKREMDSLDDFEHLGAASDSSSPLTEQAATSHARDDLVSSSVPTAEAIDTFLLSSSPPPPLVKTSVGGGAGELFNEPTAVRALRTDSEVSSSNIKDDAKLSDSLQKAQVDFAAVVAEKSAMDSNLLTQHHEIGDAAFNSKRVDDKLDKFLDDLASAPTAQLPSPVNKDLAPENPAKDLLFDDFISGDLKQQPTIAPQHVVGAKVAVDDLLERCSDSEDDDDAFKASSMHPDDDFLTASPQKSSQPPAAVAAPPVLAAAEGDMFKDFDDFAEFKQPAPQKPVVDVPPAPLPPKKEEKKPPQPEPPVAKATAVAPPLKPEPKVVEPPRAINEAEALFRNLGLDAWFNPERLDPQVESLVYWRDPKKSGPVFGGVLVVLLALTYFSFISVISYLSLLALTGTISFRIYKNVVQALQKSSEGHPFKEYLEQNLTLPQDKVDEFTKVAVAHLNGGVSVLRSLFLVEDLVDSIKFGVMLWLCTYLGAWFNGMTLIILAWVALFSFPKIYETNKTQIDANLEIVQSKLNEITSKVKAAVPIGKKAEEKKD